MTVFEPLRAMERRIRSLEEQMADPKVFSNTIEFERVSTEYDELQTEFNNSKGYQYESDTRSVFTV